jgi:hypothetical protein
MKKTAPNEFRVASKQIGNMPNDNSLGMLGVFQVPLNNVLFTIVVNDSRFDKKWEHVSVSSTQRCPTWDEMCHFKNMFFKEDETVLQFHPKKSEYKNMHPFCLHLWRDVTKEYELPPSIYVAP